VSSPAADEHFWSEILWRGVHDLLVEPHDADQVRRAVEGAIRHAYHAIPQPIRQAASASTGVVASGKLFSRSDR
jgi:hypothetical protein